MTTTITGATSGTIQEDAGSALTGTVAPSTGTVAGRTFATQARTPGLYGYFSIDAGGRWSYEIDNGVAAVQALTATQSATDAFLISYDDQVFATLKMQVLGKNDIAVISGMLSQGLDASSATSVSGTLKVDDADTGESRFAPIVRQEGTWGSFSLTADGATQYTLRPGYVGADTSRVETFALASLDGTTANVKVTVTGSPAGSPPVRSPVTGTSGDDNLASTAANEAISGGSGTDTAIYQGAAGQYTVRIDRAARTATVTDNTTGRDGADTLSGVEKIRFGSTSFDLFNPPRTETPMYSKANGFLFDASYYLLSHPELASTVSLQGAFAHYLGTGAAQGYRANAWFDSAFYGSRWSDLKGANLDAATLFQHYNLYGVWEGRSASALFDAYDGARYLRDNPDVAGYVDANLPAFLGSRTNGAIAHYVIYGAGEGRVGYTTTGTLMDAVVVIGSAA